MPSSRLRARRHLFISTLLAMARDERDAVRRQPRAEDARVVTRVVVVVRVARGLAAGAGE